MANTSSSIKRIRRTARQTAVNRNNRTQLRTQVKKLVSALEAKDAEAAQKLLPATVGSVDRAVQKGLIKKNKASRMKSRFTLRANQLSQPAAN